MQTIIAGRFDEQAESERAVRELARAGFSSNHISTFYVNPPGQHDTFPVGGDRDESQGAHESTTGLAAGTTAGGAIGAAIGAATIPVTGPLGPITGAFVGAHIGNMAGSLGAMKDSDETNEPRPRLAGMMVAVGVNDDQQAARAEELLRDLGAADVEQAQGTIENGDWIDFNPVSIPHRPDHGGMHRA
ncbi:MAG: hypothetical protein JWP36_2730 [Paucimonas sp.]|nr:hypothetical protein [Paucimonas sp.]